MNLKYDIVVSKFAFKWVNLCRYDLVQGVDELGHFEKVLNEVGLHKSNAELTHSLKPPGFNP